MPRKQTKQPPQDLTATLLAATDKILKVKRAWQSKDVSELVHIMMPLVGAAEKLGTDDGAGVFATRKSLVICKWNDIIVRTTREYIERHIPLADVINVVKLVAKDAYIVGGIEYTGTTSSSAVNTKRDLNCGGVFPALLAMPNSFYNAGFALSGRADSPERHFMELFATLLARIHPAVLTRSILDAITVLSRLINECHDYPTFYILLTVFSRTESVPEIEEISGSTVQGCCDAALAAAARLEDQLPGVEPLLCVQIILLQTLSRPVKLQPLTDSYLGNFPTLVRYICSPALALVPGCRGILNRALYGARLAKYGDFLGTHGVTITRFVADSLPSATTKEALEIIMKFLLLFLPYAHSSHYWKEIYAILSRRHLIDIVVSYMVSHEPSEVQALGLGLIILESPYGIRTMIDAGQESNLLHWALHSEDEIVATSILTVVVEKRGMRENSAVCTWFIQTAATMLFQPGLHDLHITHLAMISHLTQYPDFCQTMVCMAYPPAPNVVFPLVYYVMLDRLLAGEECFLPQRDDPTRSLLRMTPNMHPDLYKAPMGAPRERAVDHLLNIFISLFLASPLAIDSFASLLLSASHDPTIADEVYQRAPHLVAKRVYLHQLMVHASGAPVEEIPSSVLDNLRTVMKATQENSSPLAGEYLALALWTACINYENHCYEHAPLFNEICEGVLARPATPTAAARQEAARETLRILEEISGEVEGVRVCTLGKSEQT